MSIRLELLRHGETEIGGFRGSLDDALTARGWQQMSDSVKDAGGWQQIVSSPLQRCARFAAFLAEQRGLPLDCSAQWQELDFGAWEGRTAAELMATDSAGLTSFWQDPYAYTPPAAESMLDFEQRVMRALDGLQVHAGKSILLITHGGVIRLLVARARGLPRHELMQVEVNHAERFRLSLDTSGRLEALP